jgi:branched-chain amino acid transport system ATP-binding protein
MLTVTNLESYYGAAKILYGVSLHAAAGEVVALLGRNGAGKSTLMKSIIGLVVPAAGAVTLRDRDITGLPPFAIARHGLGYVPEERRIFTSLTIAENLEAGRREAAASGLSPWTPERLFKLFPNLASMRTRRAGQISGGEQQMLTIARTLMGNPSVILLDEPSEGLSPKIVEQVADAVRELRAAGLTILLSEQNMHFAALISDRAYVIEKGEIRYSGSIADLTANEEVRKTYLAV